MIKNRLVLIDAFALIYRAFYGIPAALTKDGHPINAAYGFASALLSAIKELQPEYLAAGFDLPKPTKRRQEYAEYKAHRKPMPDDLIPQIQYCKEILKALNIPIVAEEGYEGEDIIATIVASISHIADSKWQKKKNHKPYAISHMPVIESIIVTGDMDTLQLIDDNTRVYSMARGAKQAEMIDENKVKEKYGLTPEQFVDFKALKGDPSDNIPGVKGIGEKGAAMLIREFESLDNLYREIPNPKFQIQNKSKIKNSKNLNENKKISEKVLRLLIEHREQAFLSQKLSKISRDVPLEFNLSDARVHDYDHAKVLKLFNSLGFKSLIGRLPDSHRENNQQKLF